MLDLVAERHMDPYDVAERIVPFEGTTRQL
jgi:hypothetical protein